MSDIGLSFGRCLADYLRKRKLSASAFAARMGMKSRTSLVRILRDEANIESMQKVYAALLSLEGECVSEEEKSDFEEALSYHRLGPARYQSMREMWKLFRKSAADLPSDIRVLREGVFDGFCLRQHFDQLAGARRVRILLVNCCQTDFFSGIWRLFAEKREDFSLDMRHYMRIEDGAVGVVRATRAVLPVVYDPRYHGYSLREKLPNVADLLSADAMVCAVEWPDGRAEEQLLLFDCRRMGWLHVEPEGKLYAYFESILRAYASVYVPVKTSYPPGEGLAGYVAFTERYRKMEEDRAIFMFKPDFGLSQIPLEVASRALDRTALSVADEEVPLLEELYDIQRRRFQNIYAKKRVTHAILSRRAMLAFVQTGRQSDHFFAMRDYTVEERLVILRYNLAQAKNNPYYNLHFLRDDRLFQDMEFTYYEGLGLQLTQSSTRYRLGVDHTEALITHGAFLSEFREFFIQVLLKEHALPYAEGLELLQSLISSLEEAPLEDR